jgi:hypothetical protein
MQGRLGNQMFQYAAAKSLATHFNLKLFIQRSNLQNYKEQDIILNCCDLPESTMANAVVSNLLVKYKDRIFVEKIKWWTDIQNAFSSDNPVNSILKGHFQSEDYFSNHKHLIRQVFSPSPVYAKELKKQKDKIFQDSRKFCAIHIRRGDYLEIDSWTLPAKYYANALSQIPEDVTLLVN